MMLSVLLVLAVAGAVFAEDDCCSAEDRREVGFMWHHMWHTAFTDRKVTISRAVFEDLFERYPEAKALFGGVGIDKPDGPEYRAHLVRVSNGLDTIINLLQDPLTLNEQLIHLGGQHVARKGVKAIYFEAMADSFERIIPQVSSCFNIEAWGRCFRTAANRIAKDLP